jgi:hypothetical protein
MFHRDQMAESAAFIARLTKGITERARLTPQLAQNVMHSTLDIMSRFIVNQETLVKEHDGYLVCLACFLIAAKTNSVHFGGTDTLLKFYLSERPKAPSAISAPDVLMQIETELH